MSWLFSQALVAEYSEATSSAGAPSAPLSVMPTQHKFWRNDKTIEPYQLSRFGLTCAVLTEDHGEALLTWFREDSLARTSATAVIRKEFQDRVAGYGPKWPGSFAKLDQDSSSWKTLQLSFLEELGLFSRTWPKWGLMLDGECWELRTPEATSLEKGFGLWPTLKASDGEQRTSNYEYFLRRVKVAPDLPVIVALTTPPTPRGFYGRLSPDWCEWLMTWPIKWTALEPLEMDKIREWQQQHSDF